ncbi:MFS transporter [Salinibacterium sp. ZJ450]|uniref:MFS transporter n=1 Tax=Salinibacterium sp. ZJ450 TaxID=2708338 RepID=UPI001CD5D30A|nr:MFS transporter [Salinibacterium sp. ZJ450]
MTAAPSGSPDTDSIPLPLESQQTSFRARLSVATSDPVLRALLASTFISKLGRGVFLAVTVLFFTLILGLSAVQIALVLTISGGVGVATSALGGHLADRMSARRLTLAFGIVEGLALGAYAFTSDFVSVLLVACLVTAASQAGSATRSAVIARGLVGRARVGGRAAMHTATNISIAVGSAIAAVPLLIGTDAAFRITLALAGLTAALGSLPLLRLPERVDAPKIEPSSERADAASTGVSPYRDRRYLALTALSALFGLQFGLADIGLPLWIVGSTDAPAALVAALLILNTVIVIAFQIPLSRGTHDVRKAGRAMAIAGALMVAACGAYALSGAGPVAFAIALLVVAMIGHSFAEVLSTAGSWGLSFELADVRRAGAYQGVFTMAFSVSSLIAPFALIVAVSNGPWGWAVLAAVFAASAFGVWLIARRAAAHPRHGDPSAANTLEP